MKVLTEGGLHDTDGVHDVDSMEAFKALLESVGQYADYMKIEVLTGNTQGAEIYVKADDWDYYGEDA